MHITSAILLLCVSTVVSSQVLFDYKKAESSQKFFGGRTDVEIARICKGGTGGTVAISFCAKKDFEKIDGELQQALAEAVQRIEVNDGELRSAQLPVALPLFLRSQTLWEQHRDASCYATYRSLGAASDRYAEFWDCMTTLTQMRVESLNQQKVRAR
jgi:uncharacterized protein YecT (DUF1311 family)